MPLPSPRLPRCAALEPARCRAALATLAAVSLAASGGAGDALTEVGTTAGILRSGAAPSMVRLEGCVVDAHFIPKTGTPLRVLAADGRLLGNALSDGDGIFRLRLPARQTVTIEIDRPAGEVLAVPIGNGNLSVGACLSDPEG